MDVFPSVFKCDRRTIILKIESAELNVVYNDGIKTVAGNLWFGEKNEIRKVKRFQKNNSNAICAACLHAPTNNRAKNAVTLQKFLSRRRRKEGYYACTQKKWFQRRNPLWTRKTTTGCWPRRKKTLPLNFQSSDIENWQNYFLKGNFLSFCPSRMQFKDTKLDVLHSKSRLNLLHHGIRHWWMSSRPLLWEKCAEKSKYVGASSFFSPILSCRVSEWVLGNGNIGFRQKTNFRQLDGCQLTKKSLRKTPWWKFTAKRIENMYLWFLRYVKS